VKQLPQCLSALSGLILLGACAAPQKNDFAHDTALTGKAVEKESESNPDDQRKGLPLNRRTRPAIFSENRIGTNNIGPVAFHAKWNSNGQYLQQLIEAVQVEWERILTQSRNYPARGTTVSVKFRLNRRGEVSEVIDVPSESGNEQEKRNCIRAIKDCAPYGEWTEDMITVLGESQELTFTFYYQ